MSKILITGGAGFIGSKIARELLKLSHEVILYDSFVQYISPLESHYQRYLDIRFKEIKDRVTIIRGDARDKAHIRRAIVNYKPSRIIHLAALPLADMASENSEEALSSILFSTVNILEVVRDVDYVERFVYTSSSMVYGDFQHLPAEEDHPKNPKEIYGGTKLAGEILTQSFGRRHGIEYTIIRPSAVYGPTDINRRVSQIFMENALKEIPLKLHGGGDNCLDFTYVDDTAQGFIKALFSDKAKNEIFNITRGEGRSLKDFAEILKDIIPGVKTEVVPAHVFRPKRGALDISKARKLLGYEPKFSLEEGIKNTVEFMKRNGMCQ